MIDVVREWSAATGIRADVDDAIGGDGDFRCDRRVDFGRYLRRVPAAVLHPGSVDELAECVRFVRRLQLPLRVRGSGHSAGGQTLTDGGVVVLTGGLARIVDDDAADETVTVDGGATWLAVVEHLLPAGRRPLVLTDNLRTTIGGTLVVGGFGDASHLYGAQAETVERLVIVTCDGDVRNAAPGEPWFDETLYGGGRRALVAAATLRTQRRGWTLAGRMLAWRRLADFIADAVDVAAGARYDFFRARLLADDSVTAVAGNLAADAADVETPSRIEVAGPFETLDLFSALRQDPHERWQFFSPNLELVLPLPDGLAHWRSLRGELDHWMPYLPRGMSVMVLRGASRLPFAPLPSPEQNLLVAIRPELPTAELARACADDLRRLGKRALAAGARLYAASIEL